MNNFNLGFAQQLLNFVRGGGNVMQLAMQAASRNPKAAQALQMIRGKNYSQLYQTAQNMAKEYGTSVEQITSQMDISLPPEK
nr:hypothetical protein [Acutalibacter muris]